MRILAQGRGEGEKKALGIVEGGIAKTNPDPISNHFSFMFVSPGLLFYMGMISTWGM